MGRGFFSPLLRRYRAWACLLGLLLQACVAPNGSLTFNQIAPTYSPTPPPVPTQLAWTTEPASIAVSVCTANFISSVSAGGMLAPVATNISVMLVPSYGSFYNNASCATPITSTTISAQTSTQVVYYKVSTIQSVSFSATTAQLAPANYTIAITPGLPYRLAFSTIPTSQGAGTPFSFQALVEDQFGNVVTNSSNSVTVTSTGPGNLIGPTTVSAVGGTATFSSMSINIVGVYNLTATSPGLISVTSSTMIIVAAGPTKLGFSSQPSVNAVGGIAFPTQPILQVQDIYGNLVSTYSSSSVVLGAFSDPACSTAANPAMSPYSVMTSSGVANFTGVTYMGTGLIYIRASSTGLTSSCSSLVMVNPATAITAGYDSTCAIDSSSNAYCWGSNSLDQLGVNNSLTQSDVPIAVTNYTGSGNLTGIIAISSGQYHTCGLTSAGLVYCWGYNSTGQLGNGSTTSSYVPVLVSGLTNVIAISSGFFHTCALTAGQNIYCWGDNATGQLGNNTTVNISSPTLVPGPGGTGVLQNITSIGAGAGHTCAASASTTYCWGNNSNGQLGINLGGGGNVLTPFAISTLSGVTSISAGYDHTCAISAGTLYCWGDNGNGELGNTSAGSSSLVPVQVSILSSNVTLVTAGLYDTCAATSSASVYCWGINTDGQLGYGNEISLTTPSTPISSINNATTISTSNNNTCASTGSEFYCCGYNSSGQIGNGGTTSSPNPVTLVVP